MITSAPFELLLVFGALSVGNRTERENLYQAIKNGDEKAFKNFFDEHYDALYLYLRNRNISRETAEDLIQKAFIYIWENRENIKPDLSLKAYLYRIAYTRMLNHLNQKKDLLDLDHRLNGNHQTPHESAEYNDLYDAFQKAVAEMPEKRRMVFESCFLQEMTYKETAKILSVSVKTVETHMALAFKDLRSSLKIFNKY